MVVSSLKRISPTEKECIITNEDGIRRRFTVPVDPNFILKVNRYGSYKIQYATTNEIIERQLTLPKSENVILTKILSELEDGDKIEITIRKRGKKNE